MVLELAIQVPAAAAGRDVRDMDFVGGVQPETTSDRPASWRIARLIELLDAAIDSAGAQLARSEGLQFDWLDDDSATRPAGPVRRTRASRHDSLERVEEDAELHRGLDTP
ncbi:hypothetical protein GCM10029976_032250 [Kribbella albertanoniae]